MSSAVNYTDVMSQLHDAGLVLDKGLVFDARIQRWKVEGEDHERRGWSRLREWISDKGNVYIVGNYGVWHGNDDGNRRVELPKHDDEKHKLSNEDKANIRAAQKEAQRKIDADRKQEAKQAAEFAQRVWLKCKPCESHEYLTRKQIRTHGLRELTDLSEINQDNIDDSNRWRLSQAVGALVVPMHDADGTVCGLQFVYPRAHPRKQKIDRDKEFWPSGMAMGGSFGMMGHVQNNGIMLMGEGYATMASLFEATNISSCYAFSANNLLKAAKAIRKRYPKLKILFAADDDYLSPGNPGVTEATKSTAELEQTAWIKPNFNDIDGNDQRNGKKLSDFNDLYAIAGNHLTLANQINEKLTELKWRVIDALGAAPAGQGAGDDEAISLSMLYPNEVVQRFSPVWSPDDVFYFDHKENMLVSKASITGRMRRHGWDIVQADVYWQNKPEVSVSKVGFDPSGQDKNVVYNMWAGWPIAPKAGDCSALLDLLGYMCSKEPNGAVYDWILKWLAYPLQCPGAKMKTSLVFHGPQGVGKNLFFESYAKIYGDYARVIDQEALEDKFNEHYSRKLFLIADEVVARGELFHQKNKLKGITTGSDIRINPKGRAVWYEKNQINLAYLSNEQQPIVLEEDDRRYLVVLTPEKLPAEMYEMVRKELENGGVAAFYQFLLELDLGDFTPHTQPPITEAKRDLINISMPSELRFFRDWENGDTEWPFCPCASSDLYIAYTKYCRQNGIPFPRDASKFIGYAKTSLGWDKAHKNVYRDFHYEGQRYRLRMVMVSDRSMGDAVKRGMKDYRKTDDKNQEQWLTDCYLDFRNALNDEKEHT